MIVHAANTMHDMNRKHETKQFAHVPVCTVNRVYCVCLTLLSNVLMHVKRGSSVYSAITIDAQAGLVLLTGAALRLLTATTGLLLQVVCLQ
jgi:hypothetical protein